MSAKTIFIIVITILITIILMNNTDQVEFWVFGDARVSKLTILGIFFGLGLIVGFLLGRPRKKTAVAIEDNVDDMEPVEIKQKGITNEDRDYIS